MRTIVLVSGGLDSAVVAHMAMADGKDIVALSFDYGQRHRIELDAAARVAASVKARHVVQTIDMRAIGGSALTSPIRVPKERSDGIPPTYVPARNTIFISLALAWAEVTNSSEIHLGVNAVDYSGYPDCRPEYIEAISIVANVATKGGVSGMPTTIRAPLIRMSKADIIREGVRLGVDFSMTISCYDPTERKACGKCDACHLRLRGFVDAGEEDPAEYVR